MDKRDKLFYILQDFGMTQVECKPGMGKAIDSIIELYEAQAKKLMLSISKEATRLDKTIYLVPDYTKFREAIKRVGIRE